MDFWWEIFNKTGSLDAYIIYKEEKEKQDAARKDNGDSGSLNNGGRL